MQVGTGAWEAEHLGSELYCLCHPPSLCCNLFTYEIRHFPMRIHAQSVLTASL